MKTAFKVAAIQMVSTPDAARNLARACELMAQAAAAVGNKAHLSAKNITRP